MISLCITSIFPESKPLIHNTKNWIKNKIGPVFIALDKKATRPKYSYSKSFISSSRKARFEFEKICPFNTYARKNIAFLEAKKAGSDFILETDDDNQIYDTFFNILKLKKFFDIKNKINHQLLINENILIKYTIK